MTRFALTIEIVQIQRPNKSATVSVRFQPVQFGVETLHVIVAHPSAIGSHDVGRLLLIIIVFFVSLTIDHVADLVVAGVSGLLRVFLRRARALVSGP